MSELYFKKVEVPFKNTNYGNNSFQGEVRVRGEADFSTDLPTKKISSCTGAMTSKRLILNLGSGTIGFGAGLTDLNISEDGKKVEFTAWIKYLRATDLQNGDASPIIVLDDTDSSKVVTSMEVTITTVVN